MTRTPRSRSRLLRGLGFALGVGLLGWIALLGGREAWVAPFQPRSLPLVLYFLALGLAIATTSRRWQILLNALSDQALCSFGVCFLHQSIGRFLGQFTSQTGSDLVYRPLALKGAHAVPLDKALQGSLWDKSFDLLFALWLLGPALWLFKQEGSAPAEDGEVALAGLVVLALAGAWGTALVLSRFPRLIERVLRIQAIARLMSWSSQNQEDPVPKRALPRGVIPPQVVLTALALTTGKYGLLVLRAFFLAQALNVAIPPEALVVGVPVSQLSLVLAFTPGALGVLEGSWWAVFALFSVPSEDVAAFLLGQRLYQIAFLGLLALTVFLARGLWRGGQRAGVNAKMARAKALLLRIPLWIYPVGLALFLAFPATHVWTSADGGWYMSAALNIVQGKGYTDTDGSPITQRGPIFPLWLGLFFKLFGASPLTAFWAVRPFYVLGVALVYALAARLYGPTVGLLAALLVLTSYSLSTWSTLVHLDFVFPTLLLSYALLALAAVERGSRGLFAASGVLLGAVYLLKEMALIFLPLPLLLGVILGKVTRRTALRFAVDLATFLAGFLIMVLPWWAYVARVTGGPNPLGGGAGPSALRGLLQAGQEAFPWAYLRALGTYYQEYLASNFGLALPLGLSWILVFFRGLRGGRAERVLLTLLLCFLPVLVLQGLEGFRARQGIFFFLLSYVALAGSVRWGLDAIGSRVMRARPLRAITGAPLWALVGAGLVLGQIAVEGGRWGQYALQYNLFGSLAASASGRDLRWVGWLREETRQAADWLLREIPEGTPILSDWQFRTAVYFLAQGKYPLFRMPLFCSQRYSSHICVQPKVPLSSSNLKPKVLFLWPDFGGVRHALSQYELVALTEEALFEALARTHAQYVLVTLRTNFETLYFDKSPSFEKVVEFGRGMIKLYRVIRPLRPIDFPTHVGARTAEYLHALRREAPEKYERVVKIFLQERLKWSPEAVQKLLHGGYPLVELHKRYGL